MKDYIKANGIKAVITGLTAAESWNRRKMGYRYNTGTWRGGLKEETIEELEGVQKELGWDSVVSGTMPRAGRAGRYTPYMIGLRLRCGGTPSSMIFP